MEINERLKQIREDMDKSQQEIADYLKIDRKTYCRYENGHHVIKAETLIMLAKYYDLSLEYIAGLTNIKSSFNSGLSALTNEQEKLLIAYTEHPELHDAIKAILNIK